MPQRPQEGGETLPSRVAIAKTVWSAQADGVAVDDQVGDGGIDLAQAGRSPERHSQGGASETILSAASLQIDHEARQLESVARVLIRNLIGLL